MTLIVDANVLIDYADTDLSVLAIYSSHIDPIRVPRAVVDEVEQMDPSDFANHELEIVEEPLEIAMAASERRGGLSYPDRVCLLLAQRTGAICVTNEKPLLARCAETGIESKRGLRLMIDLVETGLLSAGAADEVGTAIHRANPFFINEAVLEEFRRAIGK
mgnify:CR=1 FL=1